MVCKSIKNFGEEKDVFGKKYCGNCLHHNAYDYPTIIFCMKRLVLGLNPKVSTLWCCEYWEPNMQECFCIEEAKKILASKRNQENSSEHMVSSQG